MKEPETNKDTTELKFFDERLVGLVICRYCDGNGYEIAGSGKHRCGNCDGFGRVKVRKNNLE